MHTPFYFKTPLGSVRAQLAHVGSTEDRSSTKFLSGVLGLRTSLLSGCTSLTAGFIDGHSGATKTLALRKEALSGVSLEDKLFMLVPKLIPQCMELSIMRATDNMTESVFMSWWPSNS
ncbi:hypothetical protein N7476_009093 [Penicillium atrosanguineum]|uniref:Uncharacterized protein n=1 Tax=Penicillium atrosanguineum TaxID=1132637 RepID=A0A9W9U2B4_9EURO|nr:hypothetical protein N7476_009093 [Penicillium atrosanguineum]